MTIHIMLVAMMPHQMVMGQMLQAQMDQTKAELHLINYIFKGLVQNNFYKDNVLERLFFLSFSVLFSF